MTAPSAAAVNARCDVPGASLPPSASFRDTNQSGGRSGAEIVFVQAGAPSAAAAKLCPGGSTIGICMTATISAICMATASRCAARGPVRFSSAHCTARMPKNTNASAAPKERKCASAAPANPSGRKAIAPSRPKVTDEMIVVGRNRIVNSRTIAARRARTNDRLRSGSTPRMRLSRRSGKMFSQITSVMNAVAVIDSSRPIVRSCTSAVRTAPSVHSQTYFFRSSSGSTSDGAARNAATETTRRTCGTPDGIRSLSNILEKNARVSRRVCPRSSITAA